MIVLSQRFGVDRGDVDPFDVYRALRIVTRRRTCSIWIPGCPGDRRVARVHGAARRQPGGAQPAAPATRPRGRDAEEDARMASSCRAKERAEHVHAHRLGRNDVGRCRGPASVEFRDYGPSSLST